MSIQLPFHLYGHTAANLGTDLIVRCLAGGARLSQPTFSIQCDCPFCYLAVPAHVQGALAAIRHCYWQLVEQGIESLNREFVEQGQHSIRRKDAHCFGDHLPYALFTEPNLDVLQP